MAKTFFINIHVNIFFLQQNGFTFTACCSKVIISTFIGCLASFCLLENVSNIFPVNQCINPIPVSPNILDDKFDLNKALREGKIQDKDLQKIN